MRLQSWFKGLRGKLLIMAASPAFLVAFLITVSLSGVKKLKENIE